MTTLNTIIEEEKKEARRLFDLTLDCKLVPKDIEDAITTAMQRAYEAGQSEERAKIIEEVFEVEKEKWNGAVHCTCLGYALVKLAGGEDSEGGKKMEERLLKLTPDYKDKTDDTLTN